MTQRLEYANGPAHPNRSSSVRIRSFRTASEATYTMRRYEERDERVKSVSPLAQFGKRETTIAQKAGGIRFPDYLPTRWQSAPTSVQGHLQTFGGSKRMSAIPP
jgi:hypothetical protein